MKETDKNALIYELKMNNIVMEEEIKELRIEK